MGILFSILSPALYSINNFIDKYLVSKQKINPIIFTVYSGLFGILVSIIIFIFTRFYVADLKSILIIITSGFFTLVYLLPYYKALSTDETSRVVPLFQITPVFVLILSFLFLGEKLFLKQYIGSFLIIIAGFLISLEKVDKKLFSLRPAFWLMMLSSFISALSQVSYKFGVTNIPYWHTLPYEGIGIAIGVFVLLIFPNNMSSFKKTVLKFKINIYSSMVINESIAVLARYLGFFAISLIAVSLVSVLSSLQSVFVLLYGILLTKLFPKIIKESLSKKTLGVKIFSIAIMFVGLFLIFF